MHEGGRGERREFSTLQAEREAKAEFPSAKWTKESVHEECLGAGSSPGYLAGLLQEPKSAAQKYVPGRISGAWERSGYRESSYRDQILLLQRMQEANGALQCSCHSLWVTE